MKTRFTLFCVLVAFAATVSCTKEAGETSSKKNLISETFTLSTPSTKTSLGDDGKSVTWNKDDIIVYYTDIERTDSKNSAKVSTNGQTAEVTLLREADDEFFVLCSAGIPASDMSLTKRDLNSFTPRKTLLKSQTGSFANANVSVGYKDLTNDDGDRNITMQNVTALVEFSETGHGIHKVEFMGNNNEAVSGDETNGRIVVDLTQGNFSAVPYSTSNGPQVSKVSNITKEDALDGTYYFGVFPGTFSNGVTMKFYKNASHKYTYCKVSSSSSVDFTAGKIFAVGNAFKPEKYGIDMTTASIMSALGYKSSDSTFVQKLILDDVTINAPTKEGATSKQGAYNTQWRLYQARGTELTVSTAVGKIKSVTFTYVPANDNGVILDGETEVKTDTAVAVGAKSKTFTISGSGKGQVRITNIKVILED